MPGAAQRLALARRRSRAPASPAAAPRRGRTRSRAGSPTTSTGAPSGSQRTAATTSSPWLGGARRAAPPSARSRPPSEKTIPIDRRSAADSSPWARDYIRPRPPRLSTSRALNELTIRTAIPAATPPPARRSTRPTSRRRHLVRGGGAGRRGVRRPDRGLARRPMPGWSPKWTGRLVGFAYACRAPFASGLPLGGRRLGLRRSAGHRAEGLGRALYEALFERAARRGASGSPARGSPCRTRRASPCTSASASSRSASTGGSAGRRAPGATSAGGSSIWPGRRGPPGRAG